MRTLDVGRINELANHPDVAPLLGGEAFDFTAAVASPQNIFLDHGGGVAICEWSAPRVWECHLMFDPDCRGRQAIAAASAMRDFMFEHHADMLWGRPDVSNRAARWHIRQLGFRNAGFGVHPFHGREVEFLTCHRQ